MKKPNLSFLAAVLLLITVAACEPKPQPIHYGSDQCDYCRMMITDQEFASQMVNNQGRAYKFDSVECMAAFDLTFDNPENIHSLWVPDFLNREDWLQAGDAFYLYSETLRSPMGLNLSAHGTREQAEEMLNEYGGEIVAYNRVRDIVQQAWLENGNQVHH